MRRSASPTGGCWPSMAALAAGESVGAYTSAWRGRARMREKTRDRVGAVSVDEHKNCDFVSSTAGA